MWKIITAGNAWQQTGAPYGHGEFKANRHVAVVLGLIRLGIQACPSS
jgi:hypothetical protein